MVDTILLHRGIAMLPNWWGRERGDCVGHLLARRRRKEELSSFTLGLASIEWYKLALLLKRRATGNHVVLVMGHGWIIWHRHWSVVVEQVGRCRMYRLLVENVWCGTCGVNHSWYNSFMDRGHSKTFLVDWPMQMLPNNRVGVVCTWRLHRRVI